MDETDETIGRATAGEQLRAAREKRKISLEDIAAQTRIPRRHLESVELSNWEQLPAPTYTIGFAKSYASVVGLDRNEIGDQVREELGQVRPANASAEVFEPADPARTMPKWLVLGAIAAVALVVAMMSWLNNRELEQPADEPEAAGPLAASEPPPVAAAVAPPPQAAAGGTVVLTATAPSWIQVTDQGKTLFSGELAAGQTFEVPSTATAPLLKAGKPETLRVTVGGAGAPPVGSPGKVAVNVSLVPADLMRGGAQTTLPAPSAPPAVQNGAAPAR